MLYYDCISIYQMLQLARNQANKILVRSFILSNPMFVQRRANMIELRLSTFTGVHVPAKFANPIMSLDLYAKASLSQSCEYLLYFDHGDRCCSQDPTLAIKALIDILLPGIVYRFNILTARKENLFRL